MPLKEETSLLGNFSLWSFAVLTVLSLYNKNLGAQNQS